MTYSDKYLREQRGRGEIKEVVINEFKKADIRASCGVDYSYGSLYVTNIFMSFPKPLSEKTEEEIKDAIKDYSSENYSWGNNDYPYFTVLYERNYSRSRGLSVEKHSSDYQIVMTGNYGKIFFGFSLKDDEVMEDDINNFQDFVKEVVKIIQQFTSKIDWPAEKETTGLDIKENKIRGHLGERNRKAIRESKNAEIRIAEAKLRIAERNLKALKEAEEGLIPVKFRKQARSLDSASYTNSTYLLEVRKVGRVRQFEEDVLSRGKDYVVEAKDEDGKWKAVGVKKGDEFLGVAELSIKARAKIFGSEAEAKKSGLYKRLQSAGVEVRVVSRDEGI